MILDQISDEELIAAALEEDIGSGDVTTEATVDRESRGTAFIVAKEPCVLAGLGLAIQVFSRLDRSVTFHTDFQDGDAIQPGDDILKAAGPLRALLMGERVALNFLQRLCGIATLTRRFVERLDGCRAQVTDTRKTIPGLRRLEKYAVKVGGGRNHRFGLYDGILIKDNHIEACGSITEAVNRARKNQRHLLKIEVEVSSLEQVEEALACHVDVIMLDNMNTDEVQKSVTFINGRALVEVSGGVTLESIVELAQTGVDLISVGALTHSAPAIDISMRVTL